MGTTGTITGVSRFLREQDKAVTIVGLQPEEGSSIPGIHQLAGRVYAGYFQCQSCRSGAGYPPERRGKHYARAGGERRALYCGVSSGGAVAGAIRVAEQNAGAVVVAIICDRGDRYLSTGVFGEEHFSQGAGI
ncbi:hypothetical protein ACLK1Y_13525 [Escherichia coli]